MIRPFCAYCKTFAADMPFLDTFIIDENNFRECSAEEREAYVRKEEGTYNMNNGHFACDSCYIRIGMPNGPYGWTAP